MIFLASKSDAHKKDLKVKIKDLKRERYHVQQQINSDVFQRYNKPEHKYV